MKALVKLVGCDLQLCDIQITNALQILESLNFFEAAEEPEEPGRCKQQQNLIVFYVSVMHANLPTLFFVLFVTNWQQFDVV